MAPLLGAICMSIMAIVAFGNFEEGSDARNLGANDTKAVCYGFEEEFDLCNKAKCNTCIPSNCSWTKWSEWSDMGGCIGLCARARTIQETNNECGTPCSGPKYDTKECLGDAYKKNCVTEKLDCKYSDWSKWSKCDNAMGQQYSERSIFEDPVGRGDPCVGPLKRTRPCSDMNHGESNGEMDCKFSKWAEWNPCSSACDGGHKNRARGVTTEARYGGKGCSGAISQTNHCNAQQCAHTKDATFTQWSEWTACKSEGPHGPFESYRSRDIATPASGAGKPVLGAVKEAKACEKAAEPIDCSFNPWQAWGKCTATCGGGQKYRNRHLRNAAMNGGSCKSTNMQETHGCSTDACPSACNFAKWSEWSKCSPECGAGIMTRQRAANGYDCKGPIKLVKNCTNSCSKRDCKWSEWGKWSACTLTCGGGTHTRSRQITQTPANGGKECAPLTTSEIGACSNVTCGPMCIDGEWGKWSEWSKCSVTCQTGYQSRTRQVATQPNFCGTPAAGLAVDVKTCLAAKQCVPSTDCELSEWSGWGDCQRDCFGIQESTRHIKTLAKGFYGKPCQNASLKIVRPCNPAKGEKTSEACKVGPKPVDCVLGTWDHWSGCSLQCGLGQVSRARNIDKFPEGDGKPCDAALQETGTCKVKDCAQPTCVNCKWGGWGEWSQCQGVCNGQATRQRNIVQLSNWCGKNCSMNSAIETTKCTGTCPKTVFCTWSEWETTSKCDPDGCGPRTTRDRRSLKIVDKHAQPAPLLNGTMKMTCHGNDRKISACPAKSCSPPKVDCKFAEWGKWSEPSCSQLCERVRDIKTQNLYGGKACSGDIRMTKKCLKDCEKLVDCTLSSWTEWSTCASVNSQSYRTRAVSQMMAFGGKICKGNLEETKQCTEIKVPVNCVLDEWAKWSTCTVPCGGGTRVRMRSIKTQVVFGGKPCDSTVEQVDECKSEKCVFTEKPVACEFSDWTDWQGDVKSAQKQRDRRIKTQPLRDGAACTGSLQEVRPIDPIDCDLSDWGSWDACDRDCENGQQQRKRQVNAHPRFGGKACTYPLHLLEVQGCTGKGKCDNKITQDAITGVWIAWSPCTASCGPGQQTRHRKLLGERGALGVGFTGELKQTRQCKDVLRCPRIDCKWHNWSKWSACSKECGRGQQTRSRDIAQAPQHSGNACAPLAGEETQACNMKVCATGPCVDGAWNMWSEWGSCSSSCLGGIQYRHRTVKQFANSCGKPANGADREYKSCNAQKACSNNDCEFSRWEEWGACMSQCDGVTRRQRSIKSLGHGTGAYCIGGLSELKTCNPSSTTKACAAVVKKDCEWGSWIVTPCSAKCGRGSLFTTRNIKTPAAFGGSPCKGSEQEVHPCKDLKPCPKPAPVDCVWATWSAWSACSKCGGQMKRFREISTPPQHGGKLCKATETSQTQGCDGKEFCSKTYCIWQTWSSWSGCSKRCGTGRKSRRRQLKESIKPAEDGGKNAKSKQLFNTYQELANQLEDQSGQRWRELIVAFAGGCVSFVVLASAVRFFSGRIRSQVTCDQPMPVTCDQPILVSERARSDYTQLLEVDERLPSEME